MIEYTVAKFHLKYQFIESNRNIDRKRMILIQNELIWFKIELEFNLIH